LEEAGFVENENGIREKVIKREPAFQFKSNLKMGSQGTEVTELQKCLAKDAEIYPEQEITGVFGEKTKLAIIRFQEKYKDDILTPQGLATGTGDVLKSTREKLNQLCTPPAEESLLLSFSISTVEQSILKETALLLKEQWKALGIELTVKTFDATELQQDIIKTRNYEMFLYGELLNLTPDLFPLWHSSQIKSPGFNFSGYENEDADKLLEAIRQSPDGQIRQADLEKLQNILIGDAPAVLLYIKNYNYFISKGIKGMDTKIVTDPSKRFSEINNWYIKTKRAWK
jgi:ABC-type oligopeptide transport system substrate-binding subunit